eukprot:6466315-Pyramimonas_sp.AAC.1
MQYESPVMPPNTPRPRWGHNKLAEALQTGAHREAFHFELEREMLAQAFYFSDCIENDQHIDHYYDRWAEVVQRIGLQHFAMPDPPEDTVERRLQQERLRLVRERRAHRLEAAEFFSIYGHLRSIDDTHLDCLQKARRISNQLRRWARRRRALH